MKDYTHGPVWEYPITGTDGIGRPNQYIKLDTNPAEVRCPYCTTAQKPGEVWLCRCCGGNLKASVL